MIKLKHFEFMSFMLRSIKKSFNYRIKTGIRHLIIDFYELGFDNISPTHKFIGLFNSH